MHLKLLTIKNFRNIASANLEFSPEFNFFFGKNAQGKTNLIEAIFYLSQLKSFRTHNRAELIRSGAAESCLGAQFAKDDLTWEIALIVTEAERQVTLNNKAPGRNGEYAKLIPLILFEPRHIYLFRDSPAKRREYLNRALYLHDVGFIELWRDYEQVLRQKNKLLKESGRADLLSLWDEKLVALGSEIVWRRAQWFREMAAYLTREYRELTHTREGFALTYRPCVPADEQAQIAAAFFAQLKLRSGEERERREAIVGPHRDDFVAHLDGRALGDFGSQGENRSAVVALKLAQLKLFAAKFAKVPLFLLDDVASELDPTRCDTLFSYLAQEHTQVFITTTSEGPLSPLYCGHAKGFFVENGTLAQRF